MTLVSVTRVQKCTRMPEGLETGKSIVIEAAQISAGRPALQPALVRRLLLRHTSSWWLCCTALGFFMCSTSLTDTCWSADVICQTSPTASPLREEC